MNWLRNIRVRSKLFLGFGSMGLFLILTIGAAYYCITLIQKSHRGILENTYVMGIKLTQISSNLNRAQASSLLLLTSPDRTAQRTAHEDVQSREYEIKQDMEVLQEKAKTSPVFKAQIESLLATLKTMSEGRESQIVLFFMGKVKEAKDLGVGIQNETYQRTRTKLLEMQAALEANAKSELAQVDANVTQAFILFGVLGALGVFVAVFWVAALDRLVRIPLKKLTDSAQQMATGNFAINIPEDFRKDELGDLSRAFKGMLESLRVLTKKIHEGATILGTAGSEILTTMAQVTLGTTETATAVTETTVTVEQVKQTAQHSASKAKAVSENTRQTATATIAGKNSVDETLKGMNEIKQQTELITQGVMKLNEQTQAIREIIATVNDLAEQSNLLAVNAAVEAANAGEHGKGFRSVAQEVKNLAEQSKEATAQVRSLLNEIQKAVNAAVLSAEKGAKSVEAGLKQAILSGESIRVLTDSVSEAANAATQIAVSSEQQQNGMDQVVTAMETIKKSSLQNVASIKQVEAATHDLHRLGQNLKDLAQQFQF